MEDSLNHPIAKSFYEVITVMIFCTTMASLRQASPMAVELRTMGAEFSHFLKASSLSK